MPMKPCPVCGEPSDDTRCDGHRANRSAGTAAERGYGRKWRVLSERVRKLPDHHRDDPGPKRRGDRGPKESP